VSGVILMITSERAVCSFAGAVGQESRKPACASRKFCVLKNAIFLFTFLKPIGYYLGSCTDNSPGEWRTLLQHMEFSGACGSVVGWGTMLQAGRSPVRVLDEVDFFNLPNTSSSTMALWSTQLLTEISSGNLPGGKKRPAPMADNLAAICEPNVWKYGRLNLATLSTACTEIALHF
jgi:hypothetical protein